MSDNRFREAERCEPTQVSAPADGADPYPGIDLTAAMRRLVGNRNLLERLLREFYNDYGDRGRILFSREGRAAVRRGDVAAILEWLHTLKGVAGNLSARNLHDACIELETAFRKGESNGVEGRMSRLETALNDLLRTAAACRVPAESTPARDREGIPRTGDALTCRQLIERLASHLEKNSLKAEDVLDHLKTRLAERPATAPDVSADLQTLSDQVADFAFREARETLDRMASKMESDDRD